MAQAFGHGDFARKWPASTPIDRTASRPPAKSPSSQTAFAATAMRVSRSCWSSLVISTPTHFLPSSSTTPKRLRKDSSSHFVFNSRSSVRKLVKRPSWYFVCLRSTNMACHSGIIPLKGNAMDADCSNSGTFSIHCSHSEGVAFAQFMVEFM